MSLNTTLQSLEDIRLECDLTNDTPALTALREQFEAEVAAGKHTDADEIDYTRGYLEDRQADIEAAATRKANPAPVQYAEEELDELEGDDDGDDTAAQATVKEVLTTPEVTAAALAAKKALRAAMLAKIEACTDCDVLTGSLAAELERDTRGGDLVLMRNDIAAAVQAKAKALTGRKPTKAELERLFPRPAFKKSATLTSLPLTEFGVTERLRQVHGHELRFAHDTGVWFTFENGHWQAEGTDTRVVEMARQVIKGLRPQAMSIVDPEEMEDALKKIEACERQAFASAVAKGLAGEQGVAVSSEEFDSNPDLFAVPNGVVDMRSGALLPSSPDYLMTRVAACNYDPEAQAPWFEKTVREAFRGNEEHIAFFQRLMGYAILGRPTERVMVVPLGKGKNGKSTIFNAIQDVLGSHAQTMNSLVIAAPHNAVQGGNAGGPAEHLLRLRGARTVFASETKRGSVFNDDTVKTLAGGGDVIVARGLNEKRSVEFRPMGVVISPSNVLAQVRDDDQAVWDRLLLLPFSVRFGEPGNPALDLQRTDKLKAEKEGILAWLVRGALAYQAEGLNVPESIKRLKDEQREGGNPISVFIEEYCELGSDYAATTKELFAAWKESAFEQGESRIAQSEVAFGRYLAAQAGIEKAKVKVAGKQHRGFRGIRLLKSGSRVEVDSSEVQDELALNIPF
ncbi:DNA primase family protein [Aquabacterium sp.]|uniref:DNA primase family protein n=1 Tax=Aquabacterium sp. TaxID=1872578 RepID=UPI003BAF68CE